MKRFAKAVWQGSAKDGRGMLTTQSTILNHTKYSYTSRFGNSIGTNPEELIAAAFAGCFNMQLALKLNGDGYYPEQIETRCELYYDTDKNYITNLHLKVDAVIPGLDNEIFYWMVNEVKLNCPTSKILKTTITCDAKLSKETLTPYL